MSEFFYQVEPKVEEEKSKDQGNEMTEMTVISLRSSSDISVFHMTLPVPVYVATQCLPPDLFKCLRNAVKSPTGRLSYKQM